MSSDSSQKVPSGSVCGRCLIPSKSFKKNLPQNESISESGPTDMNFNLFCVQSIGVREGD